MRLPSILFALAYLTLSAIAAPADLVAIQTSFNAIFVATHDLDNNILAFQGGDATVIYNAALKVSNLNVAATTVVNNTPLLTEVEGKAIFAFLDGQFAPLVKQVFGDLAADKAKFQGPQRSDVTTILTSLWASTKSLAGAVVKILPLDIRPQAVTLQSTLEAEFITTINFFNSP